MKQKKTKILLIHRTNFTILVYYMTTLYFNDILVTKITDMSTD